MKNFKFELQRFAIEGTAGNDTINNTVGSVQIYGYAGNDLINNTGGSVTIDGGDGNDTIISDNSASWSSASVNGGAGADIISVRSSYYGGSAVTGGTGNDTIYHANSNGLRYQYASGDGNDVFVGLKTVDTIHITSGTVKSAISGNDVILGVGSGSITLKDARGLNFYLKTGTLDAVSTICSNEVLNGTSGADNFSNTVGGATIYGNAGNDTLTNSGLMTKIYGGAGNDSISNSGASVTIDGGEGADTIYSTGFRPSILGGAGNDYISQSGSAYYSSYPTIYGGDGHDTIISSNYGARIFGDAGNDYINIYSTSTVEAGTGDDTISLSSSGHIIRYAQGDGNDVIYGANVYDTFHITSGSISSAKLSGNDVIFYVGSNSVTFKNAVSKALNLKLSDGKEIHTIFGATTTRTGTDAYDYIRNTVDGATINALGGGDYIDNTGSMVIASGGEGNDSMETYGRYATMFGGAGDDSLYVDDNIGVLNRNAYLDGGAGADTISVGAGREYDRDLQMYLENDSDGNTVDGGDDADKIYVNGNYNSINGGAGNDVITIKKRGEDYDFSYTGNTVRGGTGNDNVYFYGDDGDLVLEYTEGDGKDIITFKGEWGYSGDLKIYITSDIYPVYSYSETSDNITINVGDGAIVMKDSVWQGDVNIKPANGTHFTKITGTAKSDYGFEMYGAKDDNGFFRTDFDWGLFSVNDSMTIDALGGDDYLDSDNDYVYMFGGAGNDSIWVGGNFNTVHGDAGNDEIYVYNDASAGEIYGDAGNDYIDNSGSNMTIDAGAGDDYIENDDYASNGIIFAGAGADTVDNWASSVTVDGGAGNDSIRNYGDNVTITGGTGDDTIYLNSATTVGNVYVYNSGDGSDTIYNVTKYDTVSIGGASYSTTTSGNNVIVNVGSGKMTFINAKDTAFKILPSIKPVEFFTTGNDKYSNTVGNTILSALAGNDSILNSATNVTIYGEAGSDTIINSANNVYIDGGAGTDRISLGSSASGVTMTGGAGADHLYTNGKGNLILYGVAEGKDTIYNFGGNDTVSVSGAISGTVTSASGTTFQIGSSTNSVFIKGVAQENLSVSGGVITYTTVQPEPTYPMSLTASANAATISDNNATVYALAGNDTLKISGSQGYFDGGAGIDRISLSSTAQAVTVYGGAGNDYISLSGSKGNVVLYNAGDGADTVYGIGTGNTLKVTGAEYSTAKSGSDMVVSVGSGKVVLKNAASLDVNIDGTVKADSKSVTLTSGADNYTNRVAGATIYALAGNDTLRNSMASGAVIYGGDGKDLIYNGSPVEYGSASVRIYGGGDNDSIYNHGSNVTIDAGDGNDSVENVEASNVKIYAGTGDDYILNYGASVTIDGGDGNDYIYNNLVFNVSIDGGVGNDYIQIQNDHNYYSFDNTISGGTGNDTVYLNRATTIGNVYVYNSGDGSDTIYNVTKYDTVSIGGASYSTSTSGNNLIVSVGSGKMTFINAKDTAFTILPSIKPVEIFTTGNDKYSNTTANTVLSALAGNDSILNSASNVTIYGDAGNDTLKNSANNVYIDGGDGTDRISLSSVAQAVTIAGGAGNDYISLSSIKGNIVLYNAGDGADTVYGIGTGNTLKIDGAEYSTAKSGADMVVSVGSGKVVLKNAASLDVNIDGTETVTTPAYPRTLTSGADNATISVSSVYLDASAGADKISIGSDASNVTVYGGKGNDTIYSNGNGNIFLYNSGDGNDSITGTSANDTLKITGSTYSISGSTVSVYSGESVTGTIALKGTAPKIDGTPKPEPEYPMSLTTGADTETISDDNATVYALAGNDTLKITGSDGYFDGGAGTDRISLGSSASGVTISGGAGTDYLYTNGAGNLIQYSAGDGKDTIYNFGGEDSIQIASGTVSMKQSSANVLVTVNGSSANVLTLKNIALENLSVKGGVITYTDEPIPPDPDDYPKSLGSGNDSLEISDDNATVYAQAGRDSMTVTGNDGYFDGGANNDYIFNKGNVVTLLGGAGNDTIISEGDAATIDGGAGADSISIGAYVSGVTIIGGAGADIIHTNGGGNLIQYRSGDGNDIIYGFDGEDSISISGADAKITTSGSDAVISIGSSKITLKDHRDTNFQNKGGIITIGDSKKFLPLTDRVNTSVFGSEYNGYIIDAMGGNDLITLDGAMEISINGGKGNDIIFLDNLDANNNTIVGGAGKDTIYTNDQQNVIQYAQGDGDDIIRGFGKSDSIQITSGAVTSTVWSGSSMVFEFASGSISLRDVEFEEFEISKGDDNLNIITNKTSSAFKTGTYADDEITNTTAKVIIKALDGNDLITNKSAGNNVKISAGEGNDTIISYSNSTTLSGGTGDDTISLAGGTHNNLIQYSAGDGLDVVYGFGGKDSIKVSSGTKIAAATSGSDVQITVGADDSNVITLKNVTLANLKVDTVGNLITSRSSNGLWFVEDDTNFISAENNLDAISAVQFAVTGVASAGADIYPVDFISIASADN